MRVSVVICTYSPEMYEHFVEAVESVLDQTHRDVEAVLVVDGDPDLYEQVVDRYGTHENVIVLQTDENVGLSRSRNLALEHVGGEVVAFMDDDAVAAPDWVERLVSVYEGTDAIAVGGRMAGEWVAGEPEFLPEEFYWLVGVTHAGFAEAGEEVRNTFGSNISFRRDVLAELGGFDPRVGRRGEVNLQAEEPELGSRMRRTYGRGVVYTPDAVVYHKVFEWRTRPCWLIERAFWQGYSKQAIASTLPDGSTAEESAFLSDLFSRFVPGRIRRIATSPSSTEVKQLFALCVLTALVGAGYLYGSVRSMVPRP